MLKIEVYGLKAGARNGPPVQVTRGTIVLDDKTGKLKPVPSSKDATTLLNNMVADPIRTEAGQIIDPVDDPKSWINNAYQEYNGHRLWVSKPMEA